MNKTIYVKEDLYNLVVFVPKEDVIIKNRKQQQKRELKTGTREANKRASKKTFIELANCNDWDYFWTQTISDKFCSQLEYAECFKRLTVELNKYKKYDPDFKFQLVPELRDNGTLHFHGFAKFGEKSAYKQSDNGKLWHNGFDRKTHKAFRVNQWFLQHVGINRFEKLNKQISYQRAIEYCVKYCTKAENSPFKRLYLCSKNLKRYSKWKTTDTKVADVAEAYCHNRFYSQHGQIFIIKKDVFYKYCPKPKKIYCAKDLIPLDNGVWTPFDTPSNQTSIDMGWITSDYISCNDLYEFHRSNGNLRGKRKARRVINSRLTLSL